MWDRWQRDSTQVQGGQYTGSGGCFDGAREHTRLCTGRKASFLPSPGSWKKPWHREGPGHGRTPQPHGAWEWSWDRACPWCSRRTPGGVAPGSAHPRSGGSGAAAMCHGGQRAGRAGAGTRQAAAVARSEEPRGARGRRARGQGRWMSPLCRVCPRPQGCPLPRAPGWLRTRVCPRTRMHRYAHTDTRGPSRLRPAGFPNSWPDGAPLQPPRALP